MTTAIPNPERATLLRRRDVARLLGCSTRHVDRLSRAGKLPRPLRLGTLLRWRRSDVLVWIERGCPSIAAESEEAAAPQSKSTTKPLDSVWSTKR